MRTTMLATRLRLEESAMRSAQARGHQMTPFAALHEQPHIAEAVCEKCEAYVQVNAKTQGRPMGGTAIVFTCQSND